MNKPTHAYCNNCKKTQPCVLPKPVLNEKTRDRWGDILCGVCGFIIATLTWRTK